MANCLLLNLLLLLLLVGISRSQTGIGSEDVKPEPQPPTVPETGTGGDSILETFPSPQLPSEKAQSQGDEDAAWPVPQSDNEIDTGFDNQDEANSNIDPSNDANDVDEDTDEENDELHEGPTDDEKHVADGTLQPTTMTSLNQDDGLPSNPEIRLPSDAPVSGALNEARDQLVALAKKIPLNLAPEQMDQWRQNISDRFGLSPLETAKAMFPLGYDRDSSADKADLPVVQSQNSLGLQQNDQAEQPQNTGMENAQKSLLPFSQKGDSAPFQSQTNPGLLQNSQSLLPWNSISENLKKPQLPSDLEENNENIPGDQGKDSSHEDTVENADIGNPPSASDSDPESPGDGAPTYDTNETDEDYEVGDDNYDSKVDEKGKDARTDGMGFKEDKGYKGEDPEEDNYKDADVGNAAEFDARFKGNDREYGVNGNEASEGAAGKPDTTYEENNGPEEVINNYKPSLTQQDENENEKSDSINKINNEKGGDDDDTDSEADDDFADDQDDDYHYDNDDYEDQKHDESNGEVKNQIEDNKQNIGENDNIQNDGELEIADKPQQDAVPERYGKKESDEDDYKFDEEDMPWMNKPSDDGAKDDWYYNPGAGDTDLKSTTAGNTLASALFPELPYGQRVNKTKGASTQIAAPSEYTEGVISVEEARSRKPLQAPKGTIILYTVLIVCFIAGIVLFSIWKNPFKVSRPASHAIPVIRTGEEGKRLLDHPFV